MPFADSQNKQIIRRKWDRPILESFIARHGGSPLTYFGLTGPQLHDLLEWRDLLARERTAVEGAPKSKTTKLQIDEIVGEMNVTAGTHDIDSGFQILHGLVEDIINKGFDENADVPQINDRRAADQMKFGYGLVNLDFDGGLGNKLTRVNALKRLIERQVGTDFILMLTLNVRSKLARPILADLGDLKKEYPDPAWKAQVEWYERLGRGGEAYRLKAVVPRLIAMAASLHAFECFAYPAVLYEGHESARLVHFVFELTHKADRFMVRPPQTNMALLSLPLIQSDSGTLVIPELQDPCFRPDDCRTSLLGCLREDLVNSLLTQAGQADA